MNKNIKFSKKKRNNLNVYSFQYKNLFLGKINDHYKIEFYSDYFKNLVLHNSKSKPLIKNLIIIYYLIYPIFLIMYLFKFLVFYPLFLGLLGTQYELEEERINKREAFISLISHYVIYIIGVISLINSLI